MDRRRVVTPDRWLSGHIEAQTARVQESIANARRALKEIEAAGQGAVQSDAPEIPATLNAPGIEIVDFKSVPKANTSEGSDHSFIEPTGVLRFLGRETNRRQGTRFSDPIPNDYTTLSPEKLYQEALNLPEGHLVRNEYIAAYGPEAMKTRRREEEQEGGRSLPHMVEPGELEKDRNRSGLDPHLLLESTENDIDTGFFRGHGGEPVEVKDILDADGAELNDDRIPITGMGGTPVTDLDSIGMGSLVEGGAPHNEAVGDQPFSTGTPRPDQALTQTYDNQTLSKAIEEKKGPSGGQWHGGRFTTTEGKLGLAKKRGGDTPLGSILDLPWIEGDPDKAVTAIERMGGDPTRLANHILKKGQTIRIDLSQLAPSHMVSDLGPRIPGKEESSRVWQVNVPGTKIAATFELPAGANPTHGDVVGALVDLPRAFGRFAPEDIGLDSRGRPVALRDSSNGNIRAGDRLYYTSATQAAFPDTLPVAPYGKQIKELPLDWSDEDPMGKGRISAANAPGSHRNTTSGENLNRYLHAVTGGFTPIAHEAFGDAIRVGRIGGEWIDGRKVGAFSSFDEILRQLRGQKKYGYGSLVELSPDRTTLPRVDTDRVNRILTEQAAKARRQGNEEGAITIEGMIASNVRAQRGPGKPALQRMIDGTIAAEPDSEAQGYLQRLLDPAPSHGQRITPEPSRQALNAEQAQADLGFVSEEVLEPGPRPPAPPLGRDRPAAVAIIEEAEARNETLRREGRALGSTPLLGSEAKALLVPEDGGSVSTFAPPLAAGQVEDLVEQRFLSKLDETERRRLQEEQARIALIQQGQPASDLPPAVDAAGYTQKKNPLPYGFGTGPILLDKRLGPDRRLGTGPIPRDTKAARDRLFGFKEQYLASLAPGDPAVNLAGTNRSVGSIAATPGAPEYRTLPADPILISPAKEEALRAIGEEHRRRQLGRVPLDVRDQGGHVGTPASDGLNDWDPWLSTNHYDARRLAPGAQYSVLPAVPERHPG